MQVSAFKYQTPSLLLSSSTKNALTSDRSFTESASTSTSTVATQSSGANALDISGASSTSLRASLQAAFAKGTTVNPIDYLSSSDKALIQQTTGAVIKDGKVYDSEGNWNETQAASDLINTLFDLRTNGVPSGNKMSELKGAITSEDLQKYIDFYGNATASKGPGLAQINTAVLEKAISNLNSSTSLS